MNDDFNTAQAIAILFEQLKKLRKQINSGRAPSNLDEVKTLLENFVDGVLGIWPDAEKSSVNNKTEELIELLIDLRTEAREAKNFEQADKIRDELKEMGIELMDNPDGTTFEIKRNAQ